jgi:5-methylcytosine-specific restriction enzyme subunit McrC
MINFTKNNLNQSRLIRANAFFDSIETMNIDSFNFGKPRNNRNNKVLGVLLKYIKLFHDGFSVSYKVGDNDSYSMLFDMNKVYERFIAESYKNIFKGNCTFSVNEYLLRSIKSSEQRQKLRPDVLLKHLDKFIIIDTKWKSIKGFPSESDLYQMYAYANSIKNVEKTILLYPLSDVNQLQSETYKFNTDKDVVVSIQTVDLRLVNNKKVFEQHLIDILN